MKRTISTFLFTFTFTLAISMAANLLTVTRSQAATPADIELSIARGLSWLVSQQQPDGSWVSYLQPVDVATTGMVVLKLEDRAKELGKSPFDPSYEYNQNVINGLNYIFNHLITDANGVHTNDGLSVYNTSIALMAVSASNDPGRIATGNVSGMTYQQVAQGMLNWVVFAQNTTNSCSEYGGWAYEGPSPYCWSDNSVSGYATLGLGFSSSLAPAGFGLSIPPAVLTQLNTFIGNVQVTTGPYAGGSLYNPGWGMDPGTGGGWVNTLKTGNLLYELALVGAGVSDPRVQSAIGFIQTYWDNLAGLDNGAGWMGDYQAMFAMMKGFQSLGVQKLTVGGSEINWFDEVSNYIVANQAIDGSWMTTSGYEGRSQTLNTAWALITLEKAIPVRTLSVPFDIHPTSCPNPINTNSKGVVPAAILGTQNLDVRQIDQTSIRLFDPAVETDPDFVLPLRLALGDVATPYDHELKDQNSCTTLGPDGFMDLTLKFDTQTLVKALLQPIQNRAVKKLRVIGKLKEEYGGTTFQGEDIIWIIKNK